MLTLIVNADDFGLTKKINEGILRSHQFGILSSASLMANGESFNHAIEIIKSNPNLDIGVHLTLVKEKPIIGADKLPSLIDENGNFPKHAIDFTKKYFAEKLSFIEVKKELIAQVEKILDYGIKISHIDSHQNIHILPKILEITIELAKRYNIGFIRFPKEKFKNYMFLDLSSFDRIAQMIILNYFCSKVKKRISMKTDYFTGFYFGGRLSKMNLLVIINNLSSDGVCELMCHPGFNNDFDKSKKSQYSLVDETEGLIDQEVSATIKKKNIEISSFKILCL